MSMLGKGGAGFGGCHVVHDLVGDNRKVTVLDSLSRRGSERNLEWLHREHSDGDVRFVKGDVRDPQAVKSAAEDVDAIYHLAGQVAVTSSVQDPRLDFEINALGTLNVLEAARQSPCQPVVMFTSTNKVYGGMEDVALVEKDTSYEYRDLPDGIPESRPLDFHSPYGCSKGAADQYVRDYARIYGLRTVVFRMSCIYGPRQFGNEDQGWLAHFIISAATGAPITIYGDGKQVRDILFVEDLVRALRGATDKISVTAGKVYNIGGGPSNTLSVWQEFGQLLAELSGEAVTVSYRDWRPGDQPCYVSDIRSVGGDLGGRRIVKKRAGIRRLWEPVSSNKEVFRTAATCRSAQA